MYTLAGSILALASLVLAQDATIHVGPNAEFIFSPNNINATEGSVITFSFDGHIANHSVSQTSFAAPCSQLDGGFDSGFVFVPQDDNNGPFATFNLTITNASMPIWFYCKQTVPSPHCLAGMVGGINVAGSGQFSFDNFVSAAAAVTFPAQSTGGFGSLGAVATAPPGPFSNGVSGALNPTGSATLPSLSATPTSPGSSSAGSSTSGTSSAASTSPTSAAMSVIENLKMGVVVAAAGLAFLLM